MTRLSFFILLTLPAVFYLISCDSGGSSSSGSGPAVEISLEQAFPGIAFERPLDLQHAGDGTGRLFVAEQRGVIEVVDIDDPSKENQAIQGRDTADAQKSVFLDIEDRVLFDQSELGLLGLAFHPDYESNGYFYVNYIADNPLRNVISRFSVSGDDPNQADPGSELILLEIDHPHQFHNGGQLVFGPFDGYLYIAVGDGGPAGGTNGNSQNLSNLLGAILRIDVNGADDGLNYGIPTDNPFFGNVMGFREEIYAYGFRNPWRLAFDPLTGTLWAGDVGESKREEIDIVEKGKNYGWSIMEGNLCFMPSSGCDKSGLELPVFDYPRKQGGTIIAGAVYRGSEIPELWGKFIYGDFVSGRIWVLGYDGVTVTDNTQISQTDPFTLVSFGTDEQNEPYVCSFDGNVYRVVKDETAQN